MSDLLAGEVQTGFGDAARWPKLFNAAYSEKLGMPVFAGSLNIPLDHLFDWGLSAGRKVKAAFIVARMRGIAVAALVCVVGTLATLS